MTDEDFKTWRDRLGMTQQETADALGSTKRAVQMWEAGDRPISKTVALACAAINAGLKPIGSN